MASRAPASSRRLASLLNASPVHVRPASRASAPRLPLRTHLGRARKYLRRLALVRPREGASLTAARAFPSPQAAPARAYRVATIALEARSTSALAARYAPGAPRLPPPRGDFEYKSITSPRDRARRGRKNQQRRPSARSRDPPRPRDARVLAPSVTRPDPPSNPPPTPLPPRAGSRRSTPRTRRWRARGPPSRPPPRDAQLCPPPRAFASSARRAPPPPPPPWRSPRWATASPRARSRRS